MKFLLPTSTSMPLFFQIWEDSYQRVATQQEIYEGPRQWLLNVNPRSRGEGAGQPLTAHAYPLLSFSLAFGLALTPALEGSSQ